MSKVDGQLYEYACHEGNYGMVNILRGERMAEAREVKQAGVVSVTRANVIIQPQKGWRQSAFLCACPG